MKAKEIIKQLKKDGWYLARQHGSHAQYKHPTKPQTVTVPQHSGDLATGTLASIKRQAGI